MNIVFVKHGTSREFAFRVPDDLVPYIKKGQGVLCDTIRGLDYGTTTTGIISGDGALDIALSKGAYLPLKPIVAFEHDILRNAVINECIAKLSEKFGQPQDSIPF